MPVGADSFTTSLTFHYIVLLLLVPCSKKDRSDEPSKPRKKAQKAVKVVAEEEEDAEGKCANVHGLSNVNHMHDCVWVRMCEMHAIRCPK